MYIQLHVYSDTSASLLQIKLVAGISTSYNTYLYKDVLLSIV